MSLTTDSNSFYGRVQHELREQPTLRDVVKALLSQQLHAAFPKLTIDASRVKVALRRAENDWRTEGLLELALQRLSTGALPDFNGIGQSDCFLTYHLPTRLEYAGEPLDMGTIHALLQVLPSQVPDAVQQAILDFWQAPATIGGSRVEWLATLLRETAWAACQHQAPGADLLRGIVLAPLARQRAGIKVYTLQTTWSDRLQSRERLADVLLLSNGKQWLLFEAGGAVTAFQSQQLFDLTWAARMQRIQPRSVVKTERIEVNEDPFLAQAQIILDSQLQALADLLGSHTADSAHLEATAAAITDLASRFQATTALPHATLAPLQAALPSWLEQADAEDKARYRRHLLALASVQQRAAGKGFADGVPSLEAFAVERLRQGMWEDFPADLRYDPNDLIMTFNVASGSPGGWGLVERQTMTLPQWAIANLAGTPKGTMTFRHADNFFLSPRLTAEYFRNLISRVDIGQHYPEAVKKILSDDAVEVTRRQALYFDQLQVQLPMQALQLKIQGQEGFTDQGYELVKQVMGTNDTADAVVRPLAFCTSADATADPVTNAFVFSAASLTGPIVVYLPMSKRSLHQFADSTAFIKALATDTQLEQSLLLWMSEEARRLYGHGGFAAPHLGVTVDDPFALWLSDPARLDSHTLDNLPSQLYQAHCAAMVELADRRSISNAESRWTIIKEGGWLLFNTVQMAAQTLMGAGMLILSPLVVAGWLVQVVATLDDDFAALKRADPQQKIPAIIDLILNLGSLGLYGFHLIKGVPIVAAPAAAEAPAAAATQLLQQPLPALAQGSSDPGRALSLIHAPSQIEPQASLYTQLQRLKAIRPATLPVPIAEGPEGGLYAIEGKHFAQVGRLFFEVSVEGDNVCIVDPQRTDNHGPWLKSDKGTWTLDLKLRLRGGAPTPYKTPQVLRREALNTLKTRQLKVMAANNHSAERYGDYQDRHAELTAAIDTADTALEALEAFDAVHPNEAPTLRRSQLFIAHRTAMADARSTALSSSPQRNACVAALLSVVDTLDGMEATINEAFALGALDKPTRDLQLTRYWRDYRTVTQNLHSFYFAQYRILTYNALWITERVGIPANASPSMTKVLVQLFTDAEYKLDRAFYFANSHENALHAAKRANLDQTLLDEVTAAGATMLAETYSSRKVMFDWLVALDWLGREASFVESERRPFVKEQWENLHLRAANVSDLAVVENPSDLTLVEQWGVMDSASQVYANTEALAMYYIEESPAQWSTYYWKLLTIAQRLRVDVEARLMGSISRRDTQPHRAPGTEPVLHTIATDRYLFVGSQAADGRVLVGVDWYSLVTESGPWYRVPDARPVIDSLSTGECRDLADRMLAEGNALLPRLREALPFYNSPAKIDFAEADLLARLRSLKQYYAAREDRLPIDDTRLTDLTQAINTLQTGCLELRLQVMPRAERRINHLHFMHLHQRVQFRQTVTREAFAHEPDVFFDHYEARVGGANGRTWYVTFEYPAASTPVNEFTIGFINTQIKPLGSAKMQMAALEGAEALAIYRARFTPADTAGWFPF